MPILTLVLLSSACTPSVQQPAASPAPVAPAALPFVENDYARALADARAAKKPLFVDVWAPWCHTCQSLREYVFPDERLRRRAAEFVWLSVDMENGKNDAFLAKFPTTSVPTLWVLDPETEAPVLKWMGTATAPEIVTILDDAAQAVRRGDPGGMADAAFARGNRASAAGQAEQAVAEFRAALAAAPREWAKRPACLEALANRLSESKQHEAMVDLALAEIPRLPAGTPLCTVALLGLTSLDEVPKTAAGRDEKRAALLKEAHRIANDKALAVLADDRSGLFEALVAATREDGKEATAKVAAEWAAFLEGEAARAATPAARAVFDAHRFLAYAELGEIEAKALPMLTASQKDLPTDYNPPARLARAYYELKRLPEAKDEIERALGLAYGPRKLRIFALKADILRAGGDEEGEQRTLREATSYAKSLNLSPGYARFAASLEKRIK
jgi:uncharacterized protein YyaL (SSP411 family)